MKKLVKIISAACLWLASSVTVYAFPEYVTPYGDYCRDYNNYGECREGVSLKEAIKSIDRYYRSRGYRINILGNRGRFIEVDIYRLDKQVDKVIFDRRTGRLRSVY